MSLESFQEDIQEFGLSQETAEKLWNGNIRSIKELASSKTSIVHGIVQDDVLNTMLPVLQKYAFPIVMAKNPKEHALTLLRRAAGHEVAPSAGRTASDASPFTNDNSSNLGYNQVPSNPTGGYSYTQQTRIEGTERMDIDAGDGGFNVSFGGTPQTINYGNSMNVNISGGNMIQPNIGGKVTYNNTDVIINTSMYEDTNEARAKKRAEKVGQSSINVKGINVSTSALRFFDNPNFWFNEPEFQRVSDQDYQRHLENSDFYPIKPRNSGRALIINNVTFGSTTPPRDGAEVDSAKLEKILQKLGFAVEAHRNKKKSEIEAILHKFSTTSRNKDCSVSFVFIGSHGEREKHDHSTNMSASFVEQQNPAATVLSGTQSDAGPDDESAKTLAPQDKADMLVSFATAAGTKAYRDTQDGSWYVTALCKILQERANSEDILSMMTMVNQSVMASQGSEGAQLAVQMAEFKSTLAKKVKFFP